MSRRIALVALGVVAVLLAVLLMAPNGARGGTGGTVSIDGPLVHRGAALYAASCSQCHGVNGAGRSAPGVESGVGDVAGVGPSLRGVGALAVDFYLRTGYMPLRNPYDQPRRSRVLFSEHDLRALVAYVASLGQGPAIPHPRPALGSVSAGFSLFVQNCAGCHQISAAGGYVPDSVAPPLAADSARQIAEAVRIGPNLMPRFSRSLLSDGQLNSVIAYVRYTDAPYDRGGWSLGHIGPVPEGLVAWFIAAVVLVGVTLTVGRRLV
jgi:ubiquinol-cytochrome c reductase cytochrome c subunit